MSLAGLRGPLRMLMKNLTLVIRQSAARLSPAALQHFDIDGLFRRMANSVRKLLGATTRLKDRGHATAEDVAAVWDLLQGKQEIIKWATGASECLEPLARRAEVVQAAREQSDARFQRILATFGGKEASAATEAAALKEATSVVQRELLDRGYAPERGPFRVPTEAEHRALQDELSQRGEEQEPASPGCEEDLVARPAAAAGDPAEEENSEEAELRRAKQIVPQPDNLWLGLTIAVAMMKRDSDAINEFDRDVMAFLTDPVEHERMIPAQVFSLIEKARPHSHIANEERVTELLCDPDVLARGLRLVQVLVWGDYPGMLLLASLCSRRQRTGALGEALQQLSDLHDIEMARYRERRDAEERERNSPAALY